MQFINITLIKEVVVTGDVFISNICSLAAAELISDYMAPPRGRMSAFYGLNRKSDPFFVYKTFKRH